MQIDIILDPQVKFYFIHIHKNGGTSIRELFRDSMGYYYRHTIDQKNIDKFVKYKSLSIKTLDPNYINKNIKLEDQLDKVNIDLNSLKGFTFIRHPYIRALSIYTHFMKKMFFGLKKNENIFNQFINNSPKFKKLKSFENFLISYDHKYYNYHYIEQHKYLLPNIEVYKIDENDHLKIYKDTIKIINKCNYNYKKNFTKKLNTNNFTKKSYLKKYFYSFGLKSFHGFFFHHNPEISDKSDLINEKTKPLIEKISEKDFIFYNFKRG